MNTNLLRPRMAALVFSLCAVATAPPLSASDRDHSPGFFDRLFPAPRLEGPRYRQHPRAVRRVVYKVVYPNTRVAAVPSPSMASVAPAQTMTIVDEPVVTSEPGGLQRMEIPLNVQGRNAGNTSPRSTDSGAVIVTQNPDLSDASLALAKSPEVKTQDAVNAREPAPVPAAPKKPNLDVTKLPVATRAAKYGFVKSPYEPFNELDASGLSSGMLARDPTTGKIFRMP